jgi:hypothetical protein
MDRDCCAHDAKLVLYAYGQVPTSAPICTETIRSKTYRLDLDKPFRLLREFCREEKIPFVEEPQDFRLDHARGLLRIPKDGHLNPEGNRHAAENIVRWMDEQGLTDRTRGNQ